MHLYRFTCIQTVQDIHWFTFMTIPYSTAIQISYIHVSHTITVVHTPVPGPLISTDTTPNWCPSNLNRLSSCSLFLKIPVSINNLTE